MSDNEQEQKAEVPYSELMAKQIQELADTLYVVSPQSAQPNFNIISKHTLLLARYQVEAQKDPSIEEVETPESLTNTYLTNVVGLLAQYVEQLAAHPKWFNQAIAECITLLQSLGNPTIDLLEAMHSLFLRAKPAYDATLHSPDHLVQQELGFYYIEFLPSVLGVYILGNANERSWQTATATITAGEAAGFDLSNVNLKWMVAETEADFAKIAAGSVSIERLRQRFTDNDPVFYAYFVTEYLAHPDTMSADVLMAYLLACQTKIPAKHEDVIATLREHKAHISGVNPVCGWLVNILLKPKLDFSLTGLDHHLIITAARAHLTGCLDAMTPTVNNLLGAPSDESRSILHTYFTDELLASTEKFLKTTLAQELRSMPTIFWQLVCSALLSPNANARQVERCLTAIRKHADNVFACQLLLLQYDAAKAGAQPEHLDRIYALVDGLDERPTAERRWLLRLEKDMYRQVQQEAELSDSHPAQHKKLNKRHRGVHFAEDDAPPVSAREISLLPAAQRTAGYEAIAPFDELPSADDLLGGSDDDDDDAGQTATGISTTTLRALDEAAAAMQPVMDADYMSSFEAAEHEAAANEAAARAQAGAAAPSRVAPRATHFRPVEPTTTTHFQLAVNAVHNDKDLTFDMLAALSLEECQRLLATIKTDDHYYNELIMSAITAKLCDIPNPANGD